MRQTPTMNARLKFQRRTTTTDAYGNEEGEFTDLGVERYGELKPTRGGEDVQAARLSGRTLFDFWTPTDTEVAEVGPGDRAVDIRTGRTFNVRFNEDMDGQNQERLIQLESGVADG